MNKEGILNDGYVNRIEFENEYGFVSMNWHHTVDFEFDVADFSISKTPYRGKDGVAAKRAFDYYSSILRWCKRHNYKSKVKPDAKWDKSENKKYKNNAGKAFLVSHNFLYEVGIVIKGKPGVCTYWGHDYAAAEKKFNRCKTILQSRASKNNMRTR